MKRSKKWPGRKRRNLYQKIPDTVTLFYIFNIGQVFKLPVTGQEGDSERLCNRISNTINKRKFSSFLRIFPSHSSCTDILPFSWMGQTHTVPDLQTNFLCSIRVVPGNSICKLAKIKFSGYQDCGFILPIGRRAFQQFNNCIRIGKKGSHDLVFKFVTKGLTVNFPVF